MTGIVLSSADVYCISHAYVVGERVFVARGDALVEAKEAALFIQFTAEACCEDAWLSNQAIVNLMISNYGFKPTHFIANAELIDMYSDREFATTIEIYEQLMSKPELQRNELPEQIKLLLQTLG